ncbi:MAG: beta-lactamase family protein [Mycobacterium sp.]|nr:beta-lactamase family protein [Mycobacterium sp.]
MSMMAALSRRCRRLCAAGATALLLSIGAAAPPACATGAELDTAITAAMQATGVPGVIVGVWSPRGDYIRAVGVADTATGAPMQTDFYSRIGSETKTFTVTAVLQLADRHKIGLDDPIGRYLDGVPGGDVITVRQLAGMRSGLANYTETQGFRDAITADPHRAYSPAELLGFAFAEPPVFAPGEGLQYSNTNTILLGLLVEKISGMRLGDYLRDHVLAPLRLSHTSFPFGAEFPAPHAQGYTELTDDGPPITATDWNPSWAWSAGAMISTLADLHTWAAAVATGALLSPEMQRQRLQTVHEDGLPPDVGYGLGIFTVGGWIGHNGSLPGYQAVVVYQPETRTTLVILTNTDVSPPGGGEASSALAEAITTVITPEHVYHLGP